MRRDVRGAVARVRGDLTAAAADRYRKALSDGSSDVRGYLAVAAGLDRLASLGRAVGAATSGRDDVADAAVTAARRLRRPDTLVLRRAAVGGTDQLSLALRGPAEACAAARGIGLRPLDGSAAVPLPTLRNASEEGVRLVATLTAEHFADEDRQWQVVVTDGVHELPLTGARAALTRRWSPALSWPPRLEFDADRRLVISGRRPATAGIEHDLSLGLTTVVVRWSGSVPELRLSSQADHAALLVTGRAAAGECTASVDLLALAGRPPAIWDVAVRAGDRWQPLQLPRGDYPPMDTLGTVTLRTGGISVPVQVGYTEQNRLAVGVGAEP